MAPARGSRSIHALAAGALLVACGAPPAPQAPELGSLTIAPPSAAAVKTSGPVAPSRPDGVIAWLRLDDLDGLLDLFGVSSRTLAARQLPADALAMFEAIELHRPVDVVVVAAGRDRRDLQIAARFGLRDPKGFFDAVGKHHEVVEAGDLVHVRERSKPPAPDGETEEEADDLFVCELAGAGGERATCGTPKAMDAVAEWLRTAPEPRADDSVRSGSGPALARAVVYGDALRRVVRSRGATPGDADDRSLLALLDDVDSISLDVAHEEQEKDGLALAMGVRLRSTSSAIARELLASPHAQAPGEPFFRMWQDTSTVLFTPGGGSLPKWTAELADSMEASFDAPTKGQEPSAAAKAIGKALETPVSIGYGIRADQAKTALAAVRAAKEPDKAMQALERALDAYLVYSVAAQPAAAERALRDIASSWTTASEAREKKHHSSFPPTRYAVRAAPPKLGLPKGSFLFDITRPDWSPAGGGGKKTKTEHIVHVPVGGGTWGLTCGDEKSCAEGAKRLVSSAPAVKRELHPLFRRQGLVLAGYVSSLVGAFAMHRASLVGSTGGVPSDVLAEIEHDLASPRLELPFVLTTVRHHDGGTVAFEIRGERDAFKVLGEHAGFGGTAGVAMLFWAALALTR